jgi:hypothetical protein
LIFNVLFGITFDYGDFLLHPKAADARKRNQVADVGGRIQDAAICGPSSEVVKEPKGKEIAEGARDGEAPEV